MRHKKRQFDYTRKKTHVQTKNKGEMVADIVFVYSMEGYKKCNHI